MATTRKPFVFVGHKPLKVSAPQRVGGKVGVERTTVSSLLFSGRPNRAPPSEHKDQILSCTARFRPWVYVTSLSENCVVDLFDQARPSTEASSGRIRLRHHFVSLRLPVEAIGALSRTGIPTWYRR